MKNKRLKRGNNVKRLLIGSCGGLTGSYLTRQFKNKGYVVVGGDVSENNVTRWFVDEFYKIPSANDDRFIESIIKVLKEKEIYGYIPTHSKEIRSIAQHEKEIRDYWDGHFIVSPYETYRLLDDKNIANQQLAKIGIPVPHMYEKEEMPLEYPIFMKPNQGSGSAKAQKIETKGLYKEYMKLYPDSTFYEFLEGAEYTADCMFDYSGRLIAYNQRMRVKNMGGAVIITQNDYNFNALPYIETIAKNFVIRGCVNFQYIVSNETPYFIDINLRYASGGLPLTVASGIDIPQMILDIWEGKQLNNVCSCPAPNKTMYRYFNELYVD